MKHAVKTESFSKDKCISLLYNEKKSFCLHTIYNIKYTIKKKKDVCFLMHKTKEKEFELNLFPSYDEGELALAPT